MEENMDLQLYPNAQSHLVDRARNVLDQYQHSASSHVNGMVDYVLAALAAKGFLDNRLKLSGDEGVIHFQWTNNRIFCLFTDEYEFPNSCILSWEVRIFNLKNLEAFLFSFSIFIPLLATRSKRLLLTSSVISAYMFFYFISSEIHS